VVKGEQIKNDHASVLFLAIFMEETTVSSKGQIVIPKYIRDSLGMKEGSAVLITKIDDKILIMKKPEDTTKALLASGKEIGLKNIRREIKEE
jgi:AbrB family looped-hinge helix DNA binding protein